MPKIRLTVMDEHSGRAIPHVPFEIEAVEHFIDNTDGERQRRRHSLGVLTSNHAGYLSFDASAAESLHGEIQHFTVTSLVDRQKRLRILPEETHRPVAHPFALDMTAIPNPAPNPTLPSIQNPDLLDWKLSPGSFGSNGTPVIGADGCEVLLPSNVPERFFHFTQFVKRPDRPAIEFTTTEDSETGGMAIRYGGLLNYEMQWQPINHGLGQVLYSLTLAPCESVNLAIIDWARQDMGRRSESTAFAENIAHSQTRDRVIDEAVEAMVSEFQKGKSLLGGTAGVGGYGQGSWGVTGSHAIGIGRSQSEGERSVAADTVQQLGDRITQASNALREVRSTVVVQAGQAETDRVETRAVTNHNHCHAMTVLYYEVVRHYCLSTQLRSEQNVYFVDYSDRFIDRFQRSDVLTHRQTLESHLLDPRLAEAISAVERLEYAYGDPSGASTESPETPITRLVVDVRTGADGQRGDPVFLIIEWNDGTSFERRLNNEGVQDFRRYTNARFTFDSTDGLPARSATDINRIGIRYNKRDSNWTLAGLLIQFAAEGEDGTDLSVLYDSDADRGVPIPLPHAFTRDGSWFSSLIRLAGEVQSRARDHAMAADRLQERKLIDHLSANSHYYNKLFWLYEDADARAVRFARYERDGVRLIDAIDNHILGISGNEVAFPAGSVMPQIPGPNAGTTPDVRIISIPTRGAFAEAKLSTCNACEPIDESRFWDWSEAPCDTPAPQISGVQPGSRSQAPLPAGPTSPTATLGVEGTPETPDPTGLSAVMNLLKTPDIFRDMSGIEELGPMLQKLAEVAGAVEQQRLKEQGATEREKIKAKKDEEDEGRTSTDTTAAPGATTGIRGRNGSRSDGGDSGNVPTESPSTSARRVQREAAAFRDILNQGIDNDLLDSSQARDLYQRYAQNAVGDGASDTVSDAVTGGWWQTAAPASYEPFRAQVPFRSRYTDFRRQVVLESSEIRRGMIFRSNQEFAEQVIDRTPDLSRLHAGLLAAEGMADGAPINLWGVIIRDNRRYVMTIRFQMEILFFEGDVVEGTTLDAVFVDFIAALRDALTRITYDNALHREELHCIVDQIDSQRSAAIENLRFIKNLGTSYGDLGINWFFHHAQPWQRAMVAASGFPPGDAMGRINPVNELYMEFISTEDADARATRLASRLNWIWQDIENGISGMALRNNEGTGNIMDANEQRFYDWFINQAKHNPDSIYHCFNDRVLSFWPLVD